MTLPTRAYVSRFEIPIFKWIYWINSRKYCYYINILILNETLSMPGFFVKFGASKNSFIFVITGGISDS